MKHWSPWRNEKGATATKRKWWHGNIPMIWQLIGMSVQKKVCGCAEHAKDGGVIPVTVFPTCRWHGKRGASQATIPSRCKHEHLIQHKHLFTDDRLGVIPSKRALTERIEFGDRGTQVEEEVVVHGVVVGSSGSRDGIWTWRLRYTVLRGST